jgi:dTDP-4-dehydrorhamnose 3,5-epimerase-like enzyme
MNSGAKLLKLYSIFDKRGGLLPVEFNSLPFVPKRIFLTHDLIQGVTRGGHAHQSCHQILIPVLGEFEVKLIGRGGRDEVLLKDIDSALYIPPLVWSSQMTTKLDSTLLVIASEAFDKEDYIYSIEETLNFSATTGI